MGLSSWSGWPRRACRPDDAAAKGQVIALAEAMGFKARDAGPLRNAAVLENLCVLWIQLATVGGAGRQIALRVEGRS